MFNISDFLKRIRDARGGELALRGIIRDALQRNAGVDVPIEKISVRAGRASIQGISQAARSAIFIKKQAILKDVNAAQAGCVLSDVY